MDSATGSELLVGIAQRVTAITAALVALLAVQILVLRLLRRGRDRRAERFRARWNPLLMASLDGPPPEDLPPVPPRDLETFLHLWNRSQEVLAGAVKERLVAFAQAAGVVEPVREMLERRSVRRRLLAIQTAGNLRDRGARVRLHRILDGSNAYLSICAARALVQIDPADAVPHLVALIPRRPDWPFARLADLLKDSGPSHFSVPLAAAVRSAPPAALPRLLRLLGDARSEDALPVVREILDRGGPDEVVAACLLALGRFRDPADLDRVRTHLRHEAWFIRMHAVWALGDMGTAEDEPRVMVHLTDPEWWVRYRAAQALYKIPGMTRARMVVIRNGASDRFAKDILNQVIAEGVVS